MAFLKKKSLGVSAETKPKGRGGGIQDFATGGGGLCKRGGGARCIYMLNP